MSYPQRTMGYMNENNSNRCVIRILGLVDGTPTDFDGQYVVEYDPSRTGTQPVTGKPMPVFHLVTTPISVKRRGSLPDETVDLYRAVDQRNPIRADGEPNRPHCVQCGDRHPCGGAAACGMARRSAQFALLALVGRYGLDQPYRGAMIRQ